MNLHTRAIDALVTTAITTASTTAAAALISKLETGRAAAGLNATSHIVWGDDAARVDRADVKHTLVGAALNASAMVAWSTLSALLPGPRGLLGALTKGALVSATAYVTDYYIVPKRLTPGFEKRFSGRGLAITYAVLAGGFAAGAWLTRRR